MRLENLALKNNNNNLVEAPGYKSLPDSLGMNQQQFLSGLVYVETLGFISCCDHLIARCKQGP